MRVQAFQLRPGDVLLPTGRAVERVVTQGAFMRTATDERTRAPWPRGKVEIKTAGIVRYWNRHTVVTIEDRA